MTPNVEARGARSASRLIQGLEVSMVDPDQTAESLEHAIAMAQKEGNAWMVDWYNVGRTKDELLNYLKV